MAPYLTVSAGRPIRRESSNSWLVCLRVLVGQNEHSRIQSVSYRTHRDGLLEHVPGDSAASFAAHLILSGSGMHQIGVAVSVDGGQWEQTITIECVESACNAKQYSFDLNGKRVFYGRTKMIRTVVDLDVVHYTELAAVIQANTDSRQVLRLNERIRGLIQQSLAQILPQDGNNMPIQDTGDGAIIVFDQADAGFRFAREAHRLAAVENAKIALTSAELKFRIGIATGDVTVSRDHPTSLFRLAGTPIIAAVRLQSIAAPGMVLVDHSTYLALSDELKSLLGATQEAQVKSGTYRFHATPETFSDGQQVAAARTGRRQPKETEPSASVGAGDDAHRAIALWTQLARKENVTRLVVLIAMPPEFQPSLRLSTGEQFDEVLRWAQQQNKLSVLVSELKFLIDNS